MDDLNISISLRELMALLNGVEDIPKMQTSIESLTRRVEALHKLYLQVLTRLEEIM